MISDILSALIKKVEAFDEEIEGLEEIVKQRKDDRDRILQDDIPAVLHENGLASAPLADGRTVIIEQVLSCSQKDTVMLGWWLEENGYDSVIKTTLEFPKGSDTSEAESVLKASGVDYTKQTSVHPMTLKKVIRDHLDAGGTYPPEEAVVVNVFERSKIKEAKS